MDYSYFRYGCASYVLIALLVLKAGEPDFLHISLIVETRNRVTQKRGLLLR